VNPIPDVIIWDAQAFGNGVCHLRIRGKLYSGSWGGAIFPPDEAVTIDGAVKIKPSSNKNNGGLIFRFLSRSISLAVKGLLTMIFDEL
jgi:hypothetical protein